MPSVLIQNLGVFSAYAEVFLIEKHQHWLKKGFLRVRGGVSSRRSSSSRSRAFSPRTRRCFSDVWEIRREFFVFSAYAEVFLHQTCRSSPSRSFLRVRGGVSVLGLVPVCEPAFSPRTRRCFRRQSAWTKPSRVFSAYAEVFLFLRGLFIGPPGFLRVRGGVSHREQPAGLLRVFSPRTRRCFQRRLRR